VKAYQVQVYFWDDGDQVVKEYFFPTKELADQAMFSLNELREEERSYLLSLTDKKGKPLYYKDDVYDQLNNIRRRIINIRDFWKSPTLDEYMGKVEEMGQEYGWLPCDKDHINWEDWQESEPGYPKTNEW
jgi:hypothetical protein